MKRIVWISLFGAMAVVGSYWGFPVLFAQGNEIKRASLRRSDLKLSEVGRPEPSRLQPGLSFFTDLDEVKFLHDRSRHGSIEISAHRQHWGFKPGDPAILHVAIRDFANSERGKVKNFEKPISEEVFAELRGFVVRRDVIKRSLVPAPMPAMDGSHWVLEGKKGNFVVRHERANPTAEEDPDQTFVAIGKRFLELAGIEIPEKEFY